MPTGRTRVLLPWLITAAVVAALVAAIGVAGGWAEAGPIRGRPVPPGTEVVLERWRVTVVAAELRDREGEFDYETPDTMVVRLRLENRTEATMPFPATGVITVDTGIVEPVEYDSFRSPGGGTLSLDPRTAQDVDLTLTWPEDVDVVAPAVVVVSLSDEREDENLSGSPYWRLTGRLAEVTLPLTDRRVDG